LEQLSNGIYAVSWIETYHWRQERTLERVMPENRCPFCELALDQESQVASNRMAYVIRDSSPVTPGHSLVITKRHVESLFDITAEENGALFDLLVRHRRHLQQELNPTGFNVGVNIGQPAGQEVMHVHIHIIPRYDGPDGRGISYAISHTAKAKANPKD